MILMFGRFAMLELCRWMGPRRTALRRPIIFHTILILIIANGTLLAEWMAVRLELASDPEWFAVGPVAFIWGVGLRSPGRLDDHAKGWS